MDEIPLTEDEWGLLKLGLRRSLTDIVRRLQRAEQRLIPKEEAQQVVDVLNRIRTLADEANAAISFAEESETVIKKEDIRSHLRSIEKECVSQILSMHAYYEQGRIRPKAGE